MKVSIVIRTHNSAGTIGEVLWSLRSQRFRDYELIIVDSGSKDRTRTLLNAHGHVLVDLSRQPFTYSGALNAGCRAASGEYIVCLSSHCIPAHEEWLDRLVRALDDEQIAGAWGPPIFDDKARQIEYNQIETVGLDDFLTRPTLGLQNSSSIIRKELWQLHPFSEEVECCEDQEWAHHFLQRAYSTAIVHGAPVFYRYPRGVLSFAHKTYKNSLVLYRMFEYEGWRTTFPEFYKATLWFLKAVLRRRRTLQSCKVPIASRIGRWLAGTTLDLRNCLKRVALTHKFL